MQIHIDTAIDGPREYRAIAAALLMLAGDIPLPALSDKDDEVPAGITVHEQLRPVDGKLEAIGAMVASPSFAGTFELNGGVVFPTPPLSSPSKVIPFPPAPPIPSAPPNTSPISAPTAPNIPMPPVAPIAVVVSPAVAANIPTASTTLSGIVEYDKSGLPWDGRIHNKKRTKKLDGTWKLIKGLDPTVAQQVIQELSTRRVAPHAGGTSVSPHGVGHFPAITAGVAAMGVTPQPASNVSWNPPPAPTVPLPPTFEPRTIPSGPVLHAGTSNISNPVPLPPVAYADTAKMVPPQPMAQPVPFPPSPPGQPANNTSYGPVPPPPTAAYKQLMDKLSEATRNKTLDPRRVMPIVQKHGAPNLMALGTPEWANLIPPIERDFDLLLAGLPVEGITG